MYLVPVLLLRLAFPSPFLLVGGETLACHLPISCVCPSAQASKYKCVAVPACGSCALLLISEDAAAIFGPHVCLLNILDPKTSSDCSD